MPKAIEAKIRAEGQKRGLSGRRLDQYTYGALNNAGMMHGSKITAKGEKAESKYERDHEAEDAGDTLREAFGMKKKRRG